MTSGSKLVLVGTIWTQLSVLFLSVSVFDSLAYQVPVEPLLLGLALSAGLFWASSWLGSHFLRKPAVFLHLASGVGWIAWAAHQAHLILPALNWSLVLVCTLIGVCVADTGAEMGIEEAPVGKLVDLPEKLEAVVLTMPRRTNPKDMDSGLIRSGGPTVLF